VRFWGRAHLFPVAVSRTSARKASRENAAPVASRPRPSRWLAPGPSTSWDASQRERAPFARKAKDATTGQCCEKVKESAHSANFFSVRETLSEWIIWEKNVRKSSLSPTHLGSCFGNVKAHFCPKESVSTGVDGQHEEMALSSGVPVSARRRASERARESKHGTRASEPQLSVSSRARETLSA